MKDIKSFAVLVWGLAFLVGLIVLIVRTGVWVPMAVSRVEMPANHLVRDADLANQTGVDAFAGKYVHRHVIEQQTLHSSDVFATPLLSVDQGPLFALMTPAAAVGTNVEAQKAGMICRQTNAIAKAEAVAIMCSVDEGTDRCVALVRAVPDETRKFAEDLIKSGQTNLSFKADCAK
jgi:hypothetical protein